MTVVLDYVRKQLVAKDATDPYGRTSCNRAFLSIAILLAYLFYFPHDDWLRLGFFVKRVLPVALLAVSVWGVYYGARGLGRDARKFRAVVGIALNSACVLYHGMVSSMVALEVFYAYRDYHGVVTVMYR